MNAYKKNFLVFYFSLFLAPFLLHNKITTKIACQKNNICITLLSVYIIIIIIIFTPITEKVRFCAYNVILRRVHETIVAVEKQ